MEHLGKLIKRTTESIREDGIPVTASKIKNYIKKEGSSNHVLSKDEEAKKCFGDVLFINGCFLPHPARYRVSHQREQLLAGNLLSTEIAYTDLDINLVHQYRVFIFYRCPYTETVGKFIELAKKYHKTVLFDVDDLVIDTKYTDKVKYVENMNENDKKVYDEGVNLIQKTLMLCEGAITTTEVLAKELENYVPNVYINRNVASERMQELSALAVYERDILPFKELKVIDTKEELKAYSLAKEKKKARKNEIRLGYFSGSITHNDDFQLILPVIVKLMKKYENLKLYLVGELDLPDELELLKEKIVISPFVHWEKLPELIASVDINLAPLCDGIFNEAKSENKWLEAALVKVPTVASRVGAFEKMIEDGKTGYLCRTEQEWEEKLSILIEDLDKRNEIAQTANHYVVKHCTTMETGYSFAKFIKQKMRPNIIFVLPTAQISGGSLVVLKHCFMLMEVGLDVTILNEGYENTSFLKVDEKKIPVVRKDSVMILGSIDKAVSTLWSTVDFLIQYPNIKERFYLVQGYETNFSKPGSFFRFRVNQTYNVCLDVNYITVSKWCKNWLLEKYDKNARYAPNGIDTKLFYPEKREFDEKIRILIEGNCDDFFKNVDESFEIVKQLDKNLFEIWYMSYQGKAKQGYRVDKFLHKVPHDKVPDIYRQCHILIKSSLLESFSYPPLEMMATGGYVVVAPNEGNVEYLVDGENCLFYKHEDLQTAVTAIERIVKDKELREKLFRNGIITSKKREWLNIQDEILGLYYGK